MPYLIDGHNLIAQMADISLEDPNDEARLLSRLRSFCARTGKKVFVYFDRRAPGAQDPPPAGGLIVHFVRSPRTADDAILAHLRRLGRKAHNWTVVSSDRKIQRAAKRADARILTSSDFASSLAPSENIAEENEKPAPPSSQEEVATWERLFRNSERDG
jgi:predicted RNA-binding protein with PIN domain